MIRELKLRNVTLKSQSKFSKEVFSHYFVLYTEQKVNQRGITEGHTGTVFYISFSIVEPYM